MKENGYITLLSVLIIGAVGVAVTSSLLLLGTNATRTTSTLEQSGEAKALAQACSEIARLNIASASSYTGSGNLTLSGGTCTFTVSNTSSTSKKITTTGTYNTATRKLQLNLGLNNASPAGVATISAFEVSDF